MGHGEMAATTGSPGHKNFNTICKGLTRIARGHKCFHPAPDHFRVKNTELDEYQPHISTTQYLHVIRPASEIGLPVDKIAEEYRSCGARSTVFTVQPGKT